MRPEFFFFFAEPAKETPEPKRLELVCRSLYPLPDGRHLFIRPPIVLVWRDDVELERLIYLHYAGFSKRVMLEHISARKFLWFPSEVKEGQGVIALFLGKGGKTGADPVPSDIWEIGDYLDDVVIDIDLKYADVAIYASESNLAVPCVVERHPIPDHVEDLYRYFGVTGRS